MKCIYLLVLCFAQPSCAQDVVIATASATIVEGIGLSLINKENKSMRLINLAESLYWMTFAPVAKDQVLSIKLDDSLSHMPMITYNFP